MRMRANAKQTGVASKFAAHISLCCSPLSPCGIELAAGRLWLSRMAAMRTHRQPLEYLGGVRRFPVPEDKVPWSVEFSGYQPVDYTAPRVLAGPVWADPDIRQHEPQQKPLQFNSVDGKVDRKSHMGTYQIVDGVPRNPVGRTGMVGRGMLGRWGPNHAADPVVTRWKIDAGGAKVERGGKPVLEFVAIRRGDTGAWAIPGGMVEAGDTVSGTLKKEFGEEALNSLEATDEEKRAIEAHINQLFKSGDKLYAGYVDDPRNTDNAWMETVALNFHDDTGKAFSRLNLVAGDDAAAVAWTEIHSDLRLYASHTHFIHLSVELRGAAW